MFTTIQKDIKVKTFLLDVCSMSFLSDQLQGFKGGGDTISTFSNEVN